MRLVSFSDGRQTRAGFLSDDGKTIFPASGSGAAAIGVPDLIVGGTERLLDCYRKASAAAGVAVGGAKLQAPLIPERNIICVGKNYREHAAEFQGSGFDATSGGADIPEFPVVFTKSPGSVIGPGEAIPASSDPDNSVDYEGELAVVIGRSGRNIPAHQAMSYIFGYTIINDVTARAAQRRHKQWFLGKSLDGFCPMGPAIVCREMVPDIENCELRTFVNGELRQRAPIKDLIFTIPELIETVSRFMSLRPGDVIATGTPAGVGIGFNPPRFLKPGDEVLIQIDEIGELRNPVA